MSDSDNTRDSMSSLPTKCSDLSLNSSNGKAAIDKGDGKVKKGKALCCP